MCVTTLVYYTAYLAPLALFPCRGVSRRTDKRTVCNRSFDRASWTTSLKTSLSDGPGCWDPEAQLLLSSSRRSETCWTEKKRASTKFRCQGPGFHAFCLLPQLNSDCSSQHNIFCRMERAKQSPCKRRWWSKKKTIYRNLRVMLLY